MQVTKLDVQGYRSSVDTTFFAQETGEHLAVFLPGRGYTNLGACLNFPSELLRARGADALHVNYDYNRAEGFSDASEEEQAAWLLADVQAAVDAALKQRDYTRITLVGKSLGTYALSLLLPQDERLRDAEVVWLTPVFKYEPFLENLKACQQRSLFVIGTADPHHDEAYLEGKNSYIIEGADHSLELPGDPYASLDALRGLLERIETFIDSN